MSHHRIERDSRHQLIPDTFLVLEHTSDTRHWFRCAYVYSGLVRDPNEQWFVNEAELSDLPRAVAIRLTQQSTVADVGATAIETTPRDQSWQPSTTNPTPFPTGLTFMGTYEYGTGQSGDLSITFELSTTLDGSVISKSTWYNPEGEQIDLANNPNHQIVMRRVVASSYVGPVYMAASTYSTVVIKGNLAPPADRSSCAVAPAASQT